MNNDDEIHECPVCGFSMIEKWSEARSFYYWCGRCWNKDHGLSTDYHDALTAFRKACEESKRNPHAETVYFYFGQYDRYKNFKPGNNLKDFGDG